MSEDDFDVIVLGMGPGGETVAGRMLAADKRVAVVERELIGGECAYWGCIPSKALLRPADAQGEVQRSHGVRDARLDWAETAEYRDMLVRHLDDTGQGEKYEAKGATVVRGHARLTGPGTVQVDGRELRAADIVIATGSEPIVPPIDGLEDVGYWTNREATTLTEIPGSAIFVGGGPISIELGQFMQRFGTQVTLVEGSGRVLPREDERVCGLMEGYLTESGIDVRIGLHVSKVRRDGDGVVATLDDGAEVAADVLVVNTGRRPRVSDVGLDTVGIEFDGQALPIDERCRLADGLWAVGDATGTAMFTHVAMYQGRVVSANLLGQARTADYSAIPRVVFTDPEVAAVGLITEAAREQGIDTVEASIDLGSSIARPVTYERDPRGQLTLIADRGRGVLVGAWAVSPLASEWIHVAATAIRAAVPIETLIDQIFQFPTYSEGYLEALEALEL